MIVSTQPPVDVSVSAVAALVFAAFVVSIGYGTVLPSLPSVVEHLLGAGTTLVQVSRHTGLLTAMYTFCLFLFAPFWGHLSDQHGPHRVLVIGLVGFGITSLIFAFVEGLPALYVERALSGVFAAAVTPVAAAAAGHVTMTEESRARRLTFVSLGGIVGFLLGPTLGVVLAQAFARLLNRDAPVESITIPLAATSVLALLAAGAVRIAVPRTAGQNESRGKSVDTAVTTRRLVPRLLLLSFIVSTGIGVFEVGLALRGKQLLHLNSVQVAAMFTECSLVMFAMQAIVFSPWYKAAATRWLIMPSMVAFALALYLVPQANNFTFMMVMTGAIAASAGILSPILTYWIAAKSGHSEGSQLGKQSSAASLGATLGSAAGGLLFSNTILSGVSFILAATLALIGGVLSLRLPRLLVPLPQRERPPADGY